MEPVIVIGGPTASGKTNLGKQIAKKFNGQVISVDSRQIYTGLDIGTGKDKSFKQLMIDVADPGKTISVAKFTDLALKQIAELHQKRILPILVGGTGYYIDALLNQKEFPDASNPKLVLELNRLTTLQLITRLKRQDVLSAIRTKQNRRRLIRALEINETTGKPVPIQTNRERFLSCIIILDPGAEEGRQRITQRLKERFQQGMLEEVKQLRNTIDHQWLNNLGLEYRYISEYLDQHINYETMNEQLRFAIFAYARRQRTWFRRYKEAHWISNPTRASAIVDNFIKGYNEMNKVKADRRDSYALPGRR